MRPTRAARAGTATPIHAHRLFNQTGRQRGDGVLDDGRTLTWPGGILRKKQ